MVGERNGGARGAACQADKLGDAQAPEVGNLEHHGRSPDAGGSTWRRASRSHSLPDVIGLRHGPAFAKRMIEHGGAHGAFFGSIRALLGRRRGY
jgi:hypothetical protein